MNEQTLFDKCEKLFNDRPVASGPRTWKFLGRHMRWWHICDLIEQKEAINLKEAGEAKNPMYGNLEEAKRIQRNYHRRIERRRIKSLVNRDHKAASEMLELVGEKIIKLRELGYRKTNEYENPPNKLVLITQKWIDHEKSKLTELDKLRIKARKGGPKEIKEYIRAMATLGQR
jgi:ssDNA-binding Zn-finger/Zn-ribbon topoisomerase 1